MSSPVLFLLAAALAGLALIVLTRRPADPVTRSFALFTFGLAAWVVGIGGVCAGTNTTAWGRLTFASASLIPAAFLSFAWAYPRPSRWPGLCTRRAVWAAAIGLMLVSVVTGLVLRDAGGLTSQGLTREPGPLYPLFAGYFLAVATVGLGVFLAKWRSARGLERVQLQYLGAGLVIAAGGCVTSNLVLPLLTGQSRSSAVGPFFLLPLLLLVAHGIIRHRLLDLRLAIHRSVAFAAIIAIVWIVSWKGLSVVGALSPARLSVPTGALVLMAVAAICLSAPVARRLNRLIDTYLLRSRLEFDRALQEIARSLSRPLTLDELTASVKGVLESTLVPERLLIFTRPPSAGDEKEGRGGGVAPWAVGDHGLAVAAWAVRSAVPGVRQLRGGPTSSGTPEKPEDILRAAGIEVWIGLGRDRRRHGVVLLGPRVSGEPYLAPAVRFLEDLAEVVSMALDVAAFVTERERAEAMLASELKVLEMIATGASLETVLDALCHGVDQQFTGASSAVMLLDDDGVHLHHRTAPSLPEAYVRAIDGAAIASDGPICGVAAHFKKAVMIPDIAREALGNGYRDLALAHGLRACWSTPVCAADGTVLATFTVYYRAPRAPGKDEQRAFERATHIARIAIERARSEEVLHQTEEQLRHAQRMEALGKLAGGVAHDFNNLLTVISGRAEMARTKLDPASRAGKDIDLIHQTAERAAGLTGQLLAFSRKQVLQPKVLDLAAVVNGMVPMLRHVIGEDIDLRIQHAPGLGHVMVDQARIEQVILNLVVNARDAMPNGGELRIALDTVEQSDAHVRRTAGSRPGRHVRIAVKDTGCGMTADTRAHLFEPFFTTKERGKGTGLGLSTVYGIVRQHLGSVTAEGEPGQGSTFTVYLPCVEGVPENGGTTPDRRRGEGGSQTILLLEDEDEVRALARDVLEAAGYRVLEASNAAEALRMSSQQLSTVHLLVSDVVMPGMGGPELAQRLAATWPAMKVLYISGYAGDALTKHGVLDPAANLLPKPFAARALVQRVHDMLEST